MKKQLLLFTLLLGVGTTSLVSCNDAPDVPGYVFHVTHEKGTAMKNTVVNLVDEEGEIAATGTTDNKGNVTIMADYKDYKVTVPDLKNGYFLKDEYNVTATSRKLDVTVTSKVIENESVDPSYQYKIGDVMYDFPYKNTEEREYNLSTMFDDQDVIVFTFFYLNCGYCIQEFRLLNPILPEYEGKLKFIALDIYPESREPLAKIANAKASYGFDFEMGQDLTGLFDNFGGEGTPTTVAVNKYGIITASMVGALLSEKTLRAFLNACIK